MNRPPTWQSSKRRGAISRCTTTKDATQRVVTAAYIEQEAALLVLRKKLEALDAHR